MVNVMLGAMCSDQPHDPFPCEPQRTTLEALQVVLSTVRVRGIEIAADVGVYDHEKIRRQPLVVDVTLRILFPTGDQINCTFDYQKIATIAERESARHCDLIETLARRLASVYLEYSSVMAADVRNRQARSAHKWHRLDAHRRSQEAVARKGNKRGRYLRRNRSVAWGRVRYSPVDADRVLR